MRGSNCACGKHICVPRGKGEGAYVDPSGLGMLINDVGNCQSGLHSWSCLLVPDNEGSLSKAKERCTDKRREEGQRVAIA